MWDRRSARRVTMVKEYIALKIILFANSDWYLYNFRRSLAAALKDAGHEVLLVSPPVPMAKSFGLWVFVGLLRRCGAKASIHFGNWLCCFGCGGCCGLKSLSWCMASRSNVRFTAGLPRVWRASARVNSVTGMGYVFISDAPKGKLLRPVVRALMRVALGGERARLILQNPDDVRLFEQKAIVPRAQIRLIPGSGVDCARFFPPPGRASRRQTAACGAGRTHALGQRR